MPIKIVCLDKYGCPTGMRHILPLAAAKERIAALGLVVGQLPEAIQPPFETEYPYQVVLMDAGELVALACGGYKDLMALRYDFVAEINRQFAEENRRSLEAMEGWIEDMAAEVA